MADIELALSEGGFINRVDMRAMLVNLVNVCLADRDTGLLQDQDNGIELVLGEGLGKTAHGVDLTGVDLDYEI